MTTPLLAPPEAQPATQVDDPIPATERLARPFRLGLVGLGAAVGLFTRLLAANNIGGIDLNSHAIIIGAAIASAVMGLGLLLMAAERDRFGPPLMWISLVTALAWGSFNWISPPFSESVTVWSNPDQAVLAALGVGNGLLLAGMVALAFVRRHPTMTVATTMIAGVLALSANTIVLRDEWPAIVSLGAAFALILKAWDGSPRSELAFTRPEDPPRVSRAVLSFVSVALCGTAIQLWISRTEIPRSVPAVAVCAVLIIGAFASLVRVRREIEQRETTLSEWTSWAREIRSRDFRAEMQNFETDTSTSTSVDEPPVLGTVGEAPRKLSFPGLAYADADSVDEAIQPSLPTQPSLVADTAETSSAGDRSAPESVVVIPSADRVIGPAPLPRMTPAPVEAAPAPAKTTSGAFSSMLGAETSAPANDSPFADLDALGAWLGSPAAGARVNPLLVAVEAMTLDEFESLPSGDAAMATDEIGSFLTDTMPDADLVSWIDGPYFIIAQASKPDAELLQLNKDVLKSLKATDGTLALLRPTAGAPLDDVVNECVMALLQARRAKDHAAGR